MINTEERVTIFLTNHKKYGFVIVREKEILSAHKSCGIFGKTRKKEKKMLKKLFAIVCTVSLLGACASKQQGADLYGNATGGWRDDVNIADLKATAATEDFSDEVNAIVYFAFNSSALSDEAKVYLNEQAEWLKDNPRTLIVIEGRCDERGTREYNLALGERRANTAASYLIAKGVAKNRIKTISYGAEKPVVSGSSEEAYAKNRNATTVAY